MKMRASIVLGCVVLACMPVLVMAQVKQIQLGRPMDANPGVGNGGSNAPVTGYVPVNGNEVMTGNVTGLGYFHGAKQFVPGAGVYRSTIGTFSPYEFRGNLGTSSLSDFARQSAGGSTYGTSSPGAQAYYLPSATVSTGQGALYSAPVGSGFDSAIVPRTSVSPTATGAQLGAADPSSFSVASQYQAINRAPALSPVDAGAPGALLSSPLFILRTTAQPIKPPVDLMAPALPATRPGVDVTAPEETEKPAPGAIDTAVNTVRNAGLGGQNEIKNAQLSDNFSKLATELRSLTAPPQGDQKPGAPVAGAPTSPNSVNETVGMQDIDPFTGKARQIVMLPGGKQVIGRGGKLDTPIRGNEKGMSPQRLTALTTSQLTAGGKVKPVRLAPESLPAGASLSGYEITMSKAEQSLRAGKYLDAAETYQAALGLKPEDPLALVGRAHAEFGAGLYTSAAYDLKFVFTRKPELVSVRYDVASFIPAARQEFLMEDLQKMTGKKETSDMASFLFCYLCYQTGRNTAMQGEMKAWGERPEHDQWQFVLNRAWVRQEQEIPK